MSSPDKEAVRGPTSDRWRMNDCMNMKSSGPLQNRPRKSFYELLSALGNAVD